MASSETRQVLLRLPVDLVAQIDARCAQVGLSRNEWFRLLAQWRLGLRVTERTIVKHL